MDKRIGLRKNTQIALAPFVFENNDPMSAGLKDATVFYIDKEIARGSSAICYEAYYIDDNDKRIHGSLKEFYPLDTEFSSFDIERDESVDDLHRNQLYSHKGTLDSFLDYKNGYIRPYKELAEVRSETGKYGEESKDINRYVPDFELFRGMAPEGSVPENYTVYVWVKNEPGFVSFGQVLDDVCRRMYDGNYNRAKDLGLVLHCISVLAKAVDTLHLFGLYHLDLKPENFGIKTFRGKADEDVGISLYDLNSLYSGRERDAVVMSSGTKYFRSPEVADGNTGFFSPSSDVYSLGAILYYAIVISLRKNENTGKDEYVNIHFCDGKSEFDGEEYENIGVNLRNSDFLSDTDETGNSIVFGRLYAILRKALNTVGYENANGFYETAADFRNDLEKVIALLKEAEGVDAVNTDTGYYVESLYKTKENYYAEQSKNGAAGALQWLLYRYPLYDYCVHRENEEDGCDVLVLGGATYASKFIDLAFELSQVKNCRLDVTVVSRDSADDKATYLATRPAMADFFEIDGQKAKTVPESPYGKLTFVEREFVFDASLKSSVREICRNKRYSYVFVSLGREEKNIPVAQACAAALGTDKTKKIVSYVAFGDDEQTEEIACRAGVTTLRLSVFDSIDKHKEYQVLRRMAFNVHLTWANGYINDIQAEKAQFKSKYNFNSSLKNAMSIKYKLHSVDPSLDPDCPDVAELAARITDLTGVPGNEDSGRIDCIRELTMYEHRRWIVEKITDSWRPMKDLSALRTDTKDKTRKLHPCIVPSCGTFALSRQDWDSKWENATGTELESLDPLDRLSVEMHRHFVRESEKLKNDRRELDNQKKIVEEIAGEDTFAASVCEDLFHSIDELVNDGRRIPGVADKYRYYKKLLAGIRFPETAGQRLAAALKNIDGIVFPAIQAVLRHNWKSVDEKLIRNIPFILTYSTAFHLCVPFFAESDGICDTTGLFNNVASALMLNPLNLTFIVDGETSLKDFEGLKSSLGYCARILENHRLQTRINIAVLRNDADRFDENAKNALSDISDKIGLVDEIVCSEWNQVKALRDYLSLKSTKFTAIEINKTRIGGLLQSANELTEKGAGGKNEGLFPMYSFDSKTRTFRTTESCAFLSYVRNSPNLIINDLFYSRGKDVDFAQPELINEHEFLWNLYTGNSADHEERKKNTSAWKNLCAAIKDYQSVSDCIAKFHVFGKNYDMTDEYYTYFPAFCSDSVDMVMNALEGADIRHRFFEGGYSITRTDSASCRLTVRNVRNDVVPEIENLLKDPTRLFEKNLVELVFKPDSIGVNALSLTVENMKLPDKHTGRIFIVLNELRKKKCIRSVVVQQEENTVSFTFATENYLRLMMNEGNILELHVYRTAISSGMFDDVKNSATVFWNSGKTSNELDVIMVKGFETIIAECKATADLKPEFYDKLYPLIKTFGVNTVPVIIADLNDRVSPANRLQIKRGEELGIKTVTATDDLVEELNKLF